LSLFLYFPSKWHEASLPPMPCPHYSIILITKFDIK
jgi:hypothetical protein